MAKRKFSLDTAASPAPPENGDLAIDLGGAPTLAQPANAGAYHKLMGRPRTLAKPKTAKIYRLDDLTVVAIKQHVVALRARGEKMSESEVVEVAVREYLAQNKIS